MEKQYQRRVVLVLKVAAKESAPKPLIANDVRGGHLL